MGSRWKERVKWGLFSNGGEGNLPLKGMFPRYLGLMESAIFRYCNEVIAGTERIQFLGTSDKLDPIQQNRLVRIAPQWNRHPDSPPSETT